MMLVRLIKIIILMNIKVHKRLDKVKDFLHRILYGMSRNIFEKKNLRIKRIRLSEKDHHHTQVVGPNHVCTLPDLPESR